MRKKILTFAFGAAAALAFAAAAFAAPAQVALPGEWPDARFDRAWIVDLYRGRVLSFQDIPQRLLSGDSD